MTSALFKAFVKHAQSMQMDEDTPAEYLSTRAAVEAKFPLLKLAENPYSELAGLGVLAVPSVANMMHRPVSERTKDLTEVGGLGILAAPYAHQIAKANLPAYANMASKLR